MFEAVFWYYSVENLKESLQSKDFALLKHSRYVMIYEFQSILLILFSRGLLIALWQQSYWNGHKEVKSFCLQ